MEIIVESDGDYEGVVETSPVVEIIVDGALAGAPGEPGDGVPNGGTVGQALFKASDQDDDVVWANIPVAGGLGNDPYIYQRGISLSGMEFAKDQLPGIPGTNYTIHREADFVYYGSKGFTIVRLSILWERLQPEIYGELDPTYKGYIDNCIQYAKQNQMKIIIEPHNYGRRDVNGIERTIGDGFLAVEHFADFWRRVAGAYATETGIFMYDIMNEPHDMPIPLSPLTSNPSPDIIQLFPNPTVDYSTDGFQFDGGVGEFTWSTASVYQGSHSIKQLSASGYNSITTPLGLDVKPNTDYVFSFYHKTQTAGNFDYETPFVEINIGNPYGTIIATEQILTISGSFVRFEMTFNSGSNSKVYLRIRNNGVAVTAYYDAFNLTEGTTATPFTTAIGNGQVATVITMTQAAINAIRSVDLNHWITTPLDRYSGMQSFTSQFGTPNPKVWFTDPINKTMLTFHYYFDGDQSGVYTGGDWAVYMRDRIDGQIRPALEWAEDNNLKVFVGEFGVPNSLDTNGVEWRTDMGLFLDILDEFGAYATHWAGGSWYGSITTLQPTAALTPGVDYSTDVAQMPVLLAHPSYQIGASAGRVRVILNITSPQTLPSAADTDYVIHTTADLTMADVTGNDNSYKIRNIGSSDIDLTPAVGDTIAEAASFVVRPFDSWEFIGNNTDNWGAF